MSTLLASTIAVLVSALALAPLALGDPKRARIAQRLGALHARTLRKGPRRVLGGICLAPGLALALLGQWPAFLIWVGAAAAFGWALALTLAPRPQGVGEPVRRS